MKVITVLVLCVISLVCAQLPPRLDEEAFHLCNNGRRDDVGTHTEADIDCGTACLKECGYFSKCNFNEDCMQDALCVNVCPQYNTAFCSSWGPKDILFPKRCVPRSRCIDNFISPDEEQQCYYDTVDPNWPEAICVQDTRNAKKYHVCMPQEPNECTKYTADAQAVECASKTGCQACFSGDNKFASCKRIVDQCDAGHKAVSEWYLPCMAGEYWEPKQPATFSPFDGKCMKCPTGKSSAGPNGPFNHTSITAALGEYSEDLPSDYSVTCTLCDDDYVSRYPGSPCEPCPPGLTHNLEKNACEDTYCDAIASTGGTCMEPGCTGAADMCKTSVVLDPECPGGSSGCNEAKCGACHTERSPTFIDCVPFSTDEYDMTYAVEPPCVAAKVCGDFNDASNWVDCQNDDRCMYCEYTMPMTSGAAVYRQCNEYNSQFHFMSTSAFMCGAGPREPVPQFMPRVASVRPKADNPVDFVPVGEEAVFLLTFDDDVYLRMQDAGSGMGAHISPPDFGIDVLAFEGQLKSYWRIALLGVRKNFGADQSFKELGFGKSLDSLSSEFRYTDAGVEYVRGYAFAFVMSVFDNVNRMLHGRFIVRVHLGASDDNGNVAYFLRDTFRNRYSARDATYSLRLDLQPCNSYALVEPDVNLSPSTTCFGLNMTNANSNCCPNYGSATEGGNSPVLEQYTLGGCRMCRDGNRNDCTHLFDPCGAMGPGPGDSSFGELDVGSEGFNWPTVVQLGASYFNKAPGAIPPHLGRPPCGNVASTEFAGFLRPYVGQWRAQVGFPGEYMGGMELGCRNGLNPPMANVLVTIDYCGISIAQDGAALPNAFTPAGPQKAYVPPGFFADYAWENFDEFQSLRLEGMLKNNGAIYCVTFDPMWDPTDQQRFMTISYGYNSNNQVQYSSQCGMVADSVCEIPNDGFTASSLSLTGRPNVPKQQLRFELNCQTADCGDGYRSDPPIPLDMLPPADQNTCSSSPKPAPQCYQSNRHVLDCENPPNDDMNKATTRACEPFLCRYFDGKAVCSPQTSAERFQSESGDLLGLFEVELHELGFDYSTLRLVKAPEFGRLYQVCGEMGACVDEGMVDQFLNFEYNPVTLRVDDAGEIEYDPQWDANRRRTDLVPLNQDDVVCDPLGRVLYEPDWFNNGVITDWFDFMMEMPPHDQMHRKRNMHPMEPMDMDNGPFTYSITDIQAFRKTSEFADLESKWGAGNGGASTTGSMENQMGNTDPDGDFGSTIGPVLGALLALAIVALVVFILYRRRQDQKAGAANASMASGGAQEMGMAPGGHMMLDSRNSGVYNNNGGTAPPTNYGGGGMSYDAPPSVAGTDASTRKGDAQIDRKYLIKARDLDKGKKVGEGSYGWVYAGTWRDMEVAIKEVNLRDPDAKNQLIIEAQGMQDLRPHANIVTLYGVCEEPFAIVTEFCGRGSLDDLLYGSHKYNFTPKQKRKLVLGSAKGINHLHQEGIIHRDLAARNILVDNMWNAKVADFGMARMDEAAQSGALENQTMTKVGPIKWMAPEQLDEQKYSTASDVWSFAVICYEVMAKKPPWQGLSNMKVAQNVLNGQHLPIPKSAPQVLAEVMEECFAFNSRDRCTMSQVVKRLGRAWTVDGDEKTGKGGQQKSGGGGPPLLAPPPAAYSSEGSRGMATDDSTRGGYANGAGYANAGHSAGVMSESGGIYSVAAPTAAQLVAGGGGGGGGGGGYAPASSAAGDFDLDKVYGAVDDQPAGEVESMYDAMPQEMKRGKK